MSIARSPLQYQGVRAINPPDLIITTRAPTSTDTAFAKGQLWLDEDAGTAYQHISGGDWIALGSGTTGAIVTLTGSSGGAISPVAGDIVVTGDATDGVTVVGTAGTLTINVSAASTTQRGTLETSTDAESVTGTSAVVAVTPASLTARLAAPGAIGGTTPAAGTFTTVAAGTTVTAGTDLVSTAGNVLIQGAGKQLRVEGGAATDFIGTATLVGGTATVLNTNIDAADRIFLSRSTTGGTEGTLSYVINAGVSFVITSSSGTDTSTIAYFIVRQL